MPVTFSFVLEYIKSISFDWTFSLTKWYCVSICFDLAWHTWVFDNLMVLWLSHLITVGYCWASPTSSSIFLSHIASQVVLHNALYFDSVDDNEIVGCFLLFHDIAPNPISNTYLVVDFLSSGFLALSKSQWPVNSTIKSVVYSIPKLIVPFKYQMTLFAAIQYLSWGLSMNWLSILTA